MPDKAQPRWAIGSCSRSIVLREHAADDVFVDIEAKGTRNLLCDAGTANTGIAALELDNCVDDFLRWPFWAGAPMTFRGEKPPIFAFRERLVESQQGSGLYDHGELREFGLLERTVIQDPRRSDRTNSGSAPAAARGC